MERIVLDTGEWLSRDDFYDALLPLLRAPEWHGRSLDALWDSISSDQINELRAPYAVHLSGSRQLPEELREYLRKFIGLGSDAKEEGLAVSISADAALGVST